MSFNRKTPVRVAEVKVEPAAELEWRNDHGSACTCLACVVARGERRAAALRALETARKGAK